jgi:hypothetical protein
MGTDGRTNRQADRHYKANSRYSQFCERVQKFLAFHINLASRTESCVSFLRFEDIIRLVGKKR